MIPIAAISTDDDPHNHENHQSDKENSDPCQDCCRILPDGCDDQRGDADDSDDGQRNKIDDDNHRVLYSVNKQRPPVVYLRRWLFPAEYFQLIPEKRERQQDGCNEQQQPFHPFSDKAFFGIFE